MTEEKIKLLISKIETTRALSVHLSRLNKEDKPFNDGVIYACARILADIEVIWRLNPAVVEQLLDDLEEEEK